MLSTHNQEEDMSLLSILFGTKSEDGQNAKIRYDGVYYIERDHITTGLRFYQDGSVYRVSGPVPKDMMGFALCSEAASQMPAIFSGNYRINDSEISFEIFSSYGQIDCKGQVHRDKLFLNTYSHINGQKSTNVVFNFAELKPEFLDPRNLDQFKLRMIQT